MGQRLILQSSLTPIHSVIVPPGWRLRTRARHKILFDGDPPLFNQYGVVPVSPTHCPNVKAALAEQFADWLLSTDGQAAIAAYRRNGEQLFFPNAAR